MRASITSDEDEEDDTHIRNSCSQRKGARAEEVVYVECSNFELTDGLTFPQQQTCAPQPPRERPRSAAAREILKFGKSVIKTSSAIPGGARLVSTLHRSLFYVTSFCWNTLTVVPLLLPLIIPPLAVRPEHLSPLKGPPYLVELKPQRARPIPFALLMCFSAGPNSPLLCCSVCTVTPPTRATCTKGRRPRQHAAYVEREVD